VRHAKGNPYTDADQEFLMELADAIAAGLSRSAVVTPRQ
jgi:GAF domain-containing protein